MEWNSLNRLEEFIFENAYEGYDPYDVLSSPFLKLPMINGSRILKLGAQQAFRRLPFNFRHLVGVKKGLNSVSLGLSVQSYSYLIVLFSRKREYYERQITACLVKLIDLVSDGYNGYCWGYDFDWEARYASVPAYTPTVVATGIVTNGLMEAFRLTGNEKARALVLDASRFVLRDLQKMSHGETFCYSYAPIDHQQVYNATMKGARLLAQAYAINGDSSLLDEARATVRFVIQNQREDGSWPYSYGDARTWVDNFHTGYVLDCLDEYIRCSGDTQFEPSLKKGIEYYVSNLFSPEGLPKYYSNKLYPIDSTAAAQSILTLTRFGYIDKAERIALWMIDNMQDPAGYFYYQKHRFYTNKIPYMRWSNAWMFAALAYLLYKKNALV